MKLNKQDWLTLRGAIIAFLICLLIAAALVMASTQIKDKVENKYKADQNRFRNAASRYLSVDDEERALREVYPRFIELYNRGVIGAENRLSWIESLRAANAEIKLPDISYEILPQEVYTPPYPVNVGTFVLQSSRMRLDMQLLHEGDLLDLFAHLDANAKGHYSVSSCTLEPGADAITAEAEAENVHAECELNWLTINTAGDGIVMKQP